MVTMGFVCALPSFPFDLCNTLARSLSCSPPPASLQTVYFVQSIESEGPMWVKVIHPSVGFFSGRFVLAV